MPEVRLDTMVSETTNGIRITVKPAYLEEDSDPVKAIFRFSYIILMENIGSTKVRLLERCWTIFDSNGEFRDVHGPGVQGQKPEIGAKGYFKYMSGVELRTEMGFMEGAYRFIDMTTAKEFNVKIPTFYLLAPFKQN